MKKKGMEIELLGWWIMGLVIFGILVAGIFILKAKGFDALEYIKNIFRFGK